MMFCSQLLCDPNDHIWQIVEGVADEKLLLLSSLDCAMVFKTSNNEQNLCDTNFLMSNWLFSV